MGMNEYEDIESCRHGVAQGDVPPTPTDFGSGYVLPVHTSDLILHRINAFERDKEIVFHEVPHLYVVRGDIVGRSISSLAHDFEEPFQSIAGIRAMQKSKSQAWPRLDYVLKPVPVSDLKDLDPCKGVLIHDVSKSITVASIAADPSRTMTATEIVKMLQSVMTKKVREEDQKLYNFEREETDDEIKHKWELNGELARNLGTHAHYCMERWFNSLPIDLEYPDVKVGLQFIREALLPLGAKGFRTEIEIFAEEEDIAGSVDLAVILPNGELYLIDWKRSEKLPKKMHGYSKMKEPLSNLEDCSGCSYALQLGCYRYVLEKYYGYKVAGLALVSLHPNSFFYTSVPFLEREVEYIMEKRRLLTQTRKRLEKDPDNAYLLCSRTGHLAENAMRNKQGEIFWDKAAILYEIEAEPCPEIAREVEMLLNTETPFGTYPENLIPWRQRFPKPNKDLMAFSK